MSSDSHQRPNGAANSLVTFDYGWDVGNLHVLDRHLWLANLSFRRVWPGLTPPHLRTSPADWSRD